MNRWLLSTGHHLRRNSGRIDCWWGRPRCLSNSNRLRRRSYQRWYGTWKKIWLTMMMLLLVKSSNLFRFNIYYKSKCVCTFLAILFYKLKYKNIHIFKSSKTFSILFWALFSSIYLIQTIHHYHFHYFISFFISLLLPIIPFSNNC